MAGADTHRPRVFSGSVLLLLVLLLPAALFLISQRMELAALRVALDQQQAEEATQLADSRRAVSLLSSEVAVKTAAARAPRSPVPPPPAALPTDASILAYAKRLADPRFHEFTRFYLRQWVSSHYAILARQSGLPPAELERYMDLLADRALARKDAGFTAMQQGIYPGENPPLFKQIVAKSLEPVEADLLSVAGTEGMNALNAYDQNARGLSMVEALSANVASEATPLSDSQAMQLGKLLQDQPGAHLLPTVQVNNFDDLFVDDHAEVAITDEVIEAASSFLTPQQITVLKQRQQLQQQAGAVWKSVPGNAPPSL